MKAADLHQNGIDIDLMHINKPGKSFEVDLFFKVMQYIIFYGLDMSNSSGKM